MSADTSIGGARFDPTGRYRYTLWRDIGDKRHRVAFVMLNPSTADANVNDPTVRRCIGYACRWGFGALDVTNLFALRSTDPRALLSAADPIGFDNNDVICEVAKRARLVVCAWGSHAFLGSRLTDRARHITRALRDLGVGLHHLGLNRDRQPKHPLYLAANLRPMPWEVRT